MNTNVRSSFICNSQTIRITHISFSGQKDKHTVFPSHHGILLSHRKELIPATNWVDCKWIMLSLKNQFEKVTYHMILLFIWQSWNDKILDMENRLWLPGDREMGEVDGGCCTSKGQGILMVMDLFCIQTVVVITWIYTCNIELNKHTNKCM